MSEPRESKRVPRLGRFRLDGWVVHQDEGTLSCEDRLIHLEPRVMDVLVCLAAEPGAVVSKEDLLEIVWGGVFVEEGALAQAIHSLRKALGDDARQSRLIQTIPKRGYRLVAAVTLEGFARAHFNCQAEEAHALLLPEGIRIVVLPFENLIETQNAYFAKGLTEEIRNNLAWLTGLDVISRTSAMQYENVHKPLPEIAQELKVDYVLEGTVQWTADAEGRPRVQIRSQLVRADDTLVWAGKFFGETKDMLALESEISRQVIAQLGENLNLGKARAPYRRGWAPLRMMQGEMLAERVESVGEEQLVELWVPTESLDAYQAYLRGLELRNQPHYSKKEILKAVTMFERATVLDPHFAAAWAELSQSHCYLEFNNDLPNGIEIARKELQRAVALEPSLPSVWLACVNFVYRCERDDDATLRLLTMTPQLVSRDSEGLQTFGFVLRRKGRFEEAAESLRRAYRLDPRSAMLASEIAEMYRAMRNYEEADHFYLQAISLDPDKSSYWEGRVLTRLSWTGDVTDARAVLTQTSATTDPEILTVRFKVNFFARDYQKVVSQLTPERLHALQLVDQYHLKTLAVIARERMGDRVGARVLAEENREELQNLMKLDPKQPLYPAFLAVTLAELGQDAEALALAEKTARETKRDAYTGANFMELQAMAEAILGHSREAIGRLSRLLVTQYRRAISANDLRLDPVWDSLRGDPEFEDLLRK